MGTTVEIEHRTTGLVVRKRTSQADRATRLAHEAAVLIRARHPGVVPLVDHDAGGSGSPASIVTEFVGTHSLATQPPRTVAGVVDAMADLSATVADLHSRGIVHGAITAEHVLVDRRGRPCLCGFGRSRAPGLEPPTEATSDPPSAATPEGDVLHLGRLLIGLVEQVERGPWWCSAPRRLRRAAIGLAGRACSDDPTGRPSARALANALADLGGGAPPRARADSPSGRATRPVPAMTGSPAGSEHPDHPEPAERTEPAERAERPDHPEPAEHAERAEHPEPAERAEPAEPGILASIERLRDRGLVAPDPGMGSRRRRLAGLCSAAAALLLLAGLAVALVDPGATPAAPPLGTAIVAAPAAPRAAGSPDPCHPEAPPVTADVDGDGCAEPLRITSTRIETGDRSYQVGRVGDRVSVGDWDCDGRATPGLVRPDTGEVFLFPTWPGDESALEVAPSTTAPGAARLAPAHPCGPPILLDREGRPLAATTPETPAS